MDLQSVLKELGLPVTGFDMNQAEKAYSVKLEEFSLQLERAPTPALKEKRRQQILQLQEAWTYLQNMPQLGNKIVSTPPTRSTTGGDSRILYVDRYEVKSLLRAGAKSNLYHALDRQRQESILIRVWDHSNSAAPDDVIINLWTELIHPAIVGIRAFVRDGAQVVLVMDAIDDGGMCLSDMKGYSSDECFTLAIRLIQALEVFHIQKMVHGAICPDLIIRNNESYQLLPPFGVDSESVRGFRNSKEQNFDADSKSLARLLYWAVTGEVHFIGAPSLVASKPDFQVGLAQLIDKTLINNAVPSVHDWKLALQSKATSQVTFTSKSNTSTEESITHVKTPKGNRTHYLKYFIFALIFIGAVTVLYFFISKDDKQTVENNQAIVDPQCPSGMAIVDSIQPMLCADTTEVTLQAYMEWLQKIQGGTPKMILEQLHAVGDSLICTQSLCPVANVSVKSAQDYCQNRQATLPTQQQFSRLAKQLDMDIARAQMEGVTDITLNEINALASQTRNGHRNVLGNVSEWILGGDSLVAYIGGNVASDVESVLSNPTSINEDVDLRNGDPFVGFRCYYQF